MPEGIRLWGNDPDSGTLGGIAVNVANHVVANPKIK